MEKDTIDIAEIERIIGEVVHSIEKITYGYTNIQLMENIF